MSKLNWIETLPIDGHLAKIAGLVAENPVVIVEAEPGAGKTTRIPQALVALHSTTVHMTLPRRVAVPLIGERIASELGEEKPGRLVGWKLAREEPFTTDETRLILQVTQSMVNWIMKHKRLPEGVLLIDEAHERLITIDLLLGLVKQYLPESPKSRVLVTSATIDTEKFSKFFWDAEVVRVEGKCFPVETRPYQLDKYEHHTDGAAAAAIEELTEFVKHGSVSVAEGRAKEGAIVILLPGTEDIKTVEQKISKAASGHPDTTVEILTLTGQSASADRNKVNSPVPDGSLRFVLGTEVLRASVTVPGCIGVIDSLQIKRRVCDTNGVGHLKKIAVSLAESEQGKGRAGRVSEGFYRPVVLKDELSKLEPYPVPAILREPISSVTLQIAATGLDARTFELIDPPTPATIQAAVSRLQRIGLLDDDGAITPVGKELVDLPIDPELGMALVTARKLEVLPEAIIAAAALEQGSIFELPKPDRKLVVEEPVVRQIMARLAWDTFTQRWVPTDEFSNPAEVDLENLPEWIKPKRATSKSSSKTEFWDVDCSAVDFPVPERKEGRGPRKEVRAAWIASLARPVWTGQSRSDFVATVRAWREFMATSKRLREPQLRAWCSSHGLNYRRAQLVTQAAKQLQVDLKVKWDELLEPRQFRATLLTKALLTGLIDNLGVNLVSEPGDNPSYGSNLGPFTLLFQSAAHQACPLVLAGGVRKAARSGNLVVDLAAPVRPEWLGQLLPQLCEVTERGFREEAYFNGQLVGYEEGEPLKPLMWPKAAPASEEPVPVPTPVATPEPAKATEPPTPPAPPSPHATPPPVRESELWWGTDTEPEHEDAPHPDPQDAPSSEERIRRQELLATQANQLYNELKNTLPTGISTTRVLDVMRKFCAAPAIPDAQWAQDAQTMVNYAQSLLAGSPAA
jgi:HrpA-like RNA helicase